MATVLDPNVPAQREQLRRLFRIKRNELEMMKLRGYSLNPAAIPKDGQYKSFDLESFTKPSLTFDQFLAFRSQTGYFGNRIDFSAIYQHKLTGEQIIVLYLTSGTGRKIDKAAFSIVETLIARQQFKKFIIISEAGLGPTQQKFIENCTAGYSIEDFTDLKFAYDPLKHAFSPIEIKYILPSETNEWAKVEEIQPGQLPLILTTDPIAERYGAAPLGVFQTVIPSKTSGEEGYYRITRKPPKEKK